MTDLNARVDRLEDELFRTAPTNPGMSMRLDRMERLLDLIWKVGGAVGVLAIILKALDVVGQITRSLVTP